MYYWKKKFLYLTFEWPGFDPKHKPPNRTEISLRLFVLVVECKTHRIFLSFFIMSCFSRRYRVIQWNCEP